MRRLAVHLAVFAGLIAAGHAQTVAGAAKLKRNWWLQSACKLAAATGGAQISRPEFAASGWIRTEVPHTVEGAQVDAGVFPFDPFVGMNLRKIPGTDYPLHKIFAYLPMPADSPYRCAWWYRTEFRTPVSNRHVWLKLNGVNYHANVWLNGKKIADQAEIAGAYRIFSLDVSSAVSHSRTNVLAIETIAQTEHDLGISYLDWAPGPADKSMGLWRDVELETSGAVQVRDPAVITHFANGTLRTAELKVTADVVNATDLPQAGTAIARIGAQQTHVIVALAPHEAKKVDFPGVRVNAPRVWWPFRMGAQPLESATVSFAQHGAVSDSKTVRFGIREVTSKLTAQGGQQFFINGSPLLIRGAGWAPDMFLREPRERLAQELAYVRDMGLNTVRLEGKMGSEEFFNLADEMGILVMAGWMCCDHWQNWPAWSAEDYKIAHESQYSQISRLRHHASMLVWLNGSDIPPPPAVESDYIQVLQEREWPNPYLSSASADVSKVTGPTGVKMTGPYDYVPPEYWYLDTNKHGGAWAFNTETSPGAAIPEVSEIKRVIPPDQLWPMNDTWNYHAGEGKFAQYTQYLQGMSATYGAPESLEDFVRKSQLMSYDGERAMFEAYGQRKYGATGVIQWMLNNAWPAFIWHLYDYYLVPGAGYFATKKALEPLHVQYAYDNRSVVLVNTTRRSREGLTVSARMLDVGGKERWRQQTKAQVSADGAAEVFAVPSSEDYEGTQLLFLTLQDESGKLVGENCYWIPKQLSDLNWPASDPFYTPANRYANMQDLLQMRKAHVGMAYKMSSGGRGESVLRVDIKNTTDAPALLVHVKALKKGTDREIAPVFWDDNYVSLLPGESRTLTARFNTADAGGEPVVKLDGWNVE